MTYNKSEIMKNAWQIARLRASNANRKIDNNFPASKFFPLALSFAWKEAKEELQQKSAQIESFKKAAASTKKRYIELEAVAEKNNLNHGKTWIADSYNIDKNSLHPSWEGELVCYVYAA